jgi:mycothiol synthase
VTGQPTAQRPAGGGQPDIRASGPLTGPAAADVLDLARRAARVDGVRPLSEHVLLHLRYGGDPRARNLLVLRDGRLAGYGHLDPAGPMDSPSAEVVIDPAFRRQGLGLALVRALTDQAGGRLRLWAHGDLPAARRLAAAAGLRRARALWQMRRSLQTATGAPELPDGVRVRSFVVGRDEDDWLRLNHRAFARHPEQGSWTRADLETREREPWFDADGFFLAERDHRLIGFHWTKIHGPARRQAGAAPPAGPGREPIGEVYVVGVDPDARGTGLGRALTLIGLDYLRARGMPTVMLYVDAENTAAIRLYESLGFTRWGTDVMFSLAPARALGGGPSPANTGCSGGLSRRESTGGSGGLSRRENTGGSGGMSPRANTAGGTPST